MIGTGPRFFRKGLPLLYKSLIRRAEWKRERRGEEGIMVRGTGRRVIVVKSPDPQVFEEAIFVLREDWIRKRSADQVVEEARRAAGDYMKLCSVPRPRPVRRHRAAIAAAGTFCAGIVWVLIRLLGGG